MKFLLEPLVNLFGRKVWAPIEFRRVEQFIEKGERVLDIGAGGGWTGELLADMKESEVVLLDVKDFNHSKLPLVVYDGNKMPFDENSFDVSLLLFVLHHCEDPAAVLKEAMRVSKRVIVIEDTFYTRWGKMVACINDVVTNIPSFFVSKGGMHLPFQFKKISEWRELFKGIGIRLTYAEQRRLFGLLPQKTLFVLDK